MVYYRWSPRQLRNCMAIEERAKPTSLSCHVTTRGCPGSIWGPAEDVTHWLFVQKCLVRKEVVWSFLHCNSIASFPGSCIIGNAVKSKWEGSKLKPGSVNLIYCGAGGRECRANSDFSPRPLFPLHPPRQTLGRCTSGVLRRLLPAPMLRLWLGLPSLTQRTPLQTS